MELCEENLEVAMEELRQALGTLFGYDEASRKVIFRIHPIYLKRYQNNNLRLLITRLESLGKLS